MYVCMFLCICFYLFLIVCLCVNMGAVPKEARCQIPWSWRCSQDAHTQNNKSKTTIFYGLNFTQKIYVNFQQLLKLILQNIANI